MQSTKAYTFSTDSAPEGRPQVESPFEYAQTATSGQRLYTIRLDTHQASSPSGALILENALDIAGPDSEQAGDSSNI